MKTIIVDKENYYKYVEKMIECLRFLYYLEDKFDYDCKAISNCIDELQEIEFKECEE